MYKKINKIEDLLFLGDFEGACNQSLLNNLDIKTVITIKDSEIPNDKRSDGVIYQSIIADDHPSVDLLSHFHETNAWITYGQSKGHGVLVHCQAGMSRSATVVIAFLMNKYNKSSTETKTLVKSKRSVVSPNFGFEAQLQIYEDMNYRLDPNNRAFRRHLMNSLLFKDERRHIKPLDNYFERREYCQRLTRVNFGQTYVCINCSHSLFREINVIRNVSIDGQNSGKCCEDIYIEPQVWMNNRINGLFEDQKGVDNSILCPVCSLKLGETYPLVNFFGSEFESYECQCPNHRLIRCLYFKIDSNKVKLK